MLKSFICFLGLCSLTHASINVVEVPQGRESLTKPTCVVISADSPKKDDIITNLQNSKSNWSTHLFIGLDGKVTCFVPDDSQLVNKKKFPSKSEEVLRERERIKNISYGDYSGLADYLMNSHYVTGLCGSRSGWSQNTGVNNFSINIMLQRSLTVENQKLEEKSGYTDENLYTNDQMDTIHNILKALKLRGISEENILGISDVALSAVHIAPYSSFWRQFDDRHPGFFYVPEFIVTYKSDDADKIKDILLKIGYTNPIDPETNAKCMTEDYFFRRAINAFILHYLPKEEFRLDVLDETANAGESAYLDADISSNKEQTYYNVLKDHHPEILSAIEEIASL